MSDDGSNLEVNALTKIYGGTGGGGILPLSISLKPGAFFTMLGPSGCGKTTSLRCIAGLEQPDGGSIRLGNTEFFNAASKVNVPLNKRGLGMVFQSYAIWPHMSVFENVAFPLRVSSEKRCSAAEINQRVGEALEIVGMSAFSSRSATQLSGGQQQRVAFARAIVKRPRLLLLDEPLSNLDAQLRDDMRTELKRLQRQLNITTVYVTHDQAEALDMSDTIAVINKGRLVQIGSPREIYFKPRDSFIAGFLGAMNLLEGRLNNDVKEGERAQVVLADGSVVVAQFPYAVSAGSVSVSVRPEAFILQRAGTSPADEHNRFEGEIKSAGFVGHANRYTVAVKDFDIQISSGADLNFTPGEKVLVDFAFANSLGLANSPAFTPKAAA